ncbi:MAG: tail fiber domain-containing protein [Anaerolineae bacterium]
MTGKIKWIVLSIVLSVMGSLLTASVLAGPATGPFQLQGDGAQAAAVGTGFIYQGKLENGDGPVTASCNMDFRLYDDVGGGGSQVGSSIVTTVPITDGLFTVNLDFGTVFTGTALWLEVAVQCPGDASFTTLSPRQALTPAPYALALPGLWTQQNGTSPNLVGGFGGNGFDEGVVGATIGGGGHAGYPNRVTGDFGTIGGGGNNIAGTNSTVSGGYENEASDDGATVGGGVYNTASGCFATISGGLYNVAIYCNSTVGGGKSNAANAWAATVGGGITNTVEGAWATIGGGISNTVTADAPEATIGGGYANVADGPDTTVGGGINNTASGDFATVGGGDGNTASGFSAAIGGGFENTASGEFATIGGGNSNAASGASATVGGGYGNTSSYTHTTVAGGYNNIASGDSSTIGGGTDNTASGNRTTVGGGNLNIASGDLATVSGGYDNTASGDFAIIPGGFSNTASGGYSFAAGDDANATHPGSFVWSSGYESTSSWYTNTFTARAHGGVRFYTASGTGTGVQLSAGGGSWGTLSDRNAKANFADVDPEQVLEVLAAMPIQTWNYNTQPPDLRHIGPVAQDFNGDFAFLFGEVESPTHINSMDAVGVALVAIQGLYTQNQELAAENDALQQQVDDLEARVAALESASGNGSAPVSYASLLPWGAVLLVGGGVAWASRRRDAPGLPNGGGR